VPFGSREWTRVQAGVLQTGSTASSALQIAFELCRKHGFSDGSYYLWRSKFGGMSVSDAKRLKELESENGRLKRLLADSLLENEVTREVLRKKW